MVQARLKTFMIELPYEITCYEALKNLCVSFEYMPDKKKTQWSFYFVNLEDVLELIAMPIEFSIGDATISKLLDHCPNLEEEIFVRRYKGKGQIKVRRMQKQIEKDGPEVTIFKISWQQRKKPVHKYLPVEAVEKLWDVMMKFPKDEEVKSSKTWEQWCKALGIIRYNRKTGSFDKDKFFGDRKTYFKWWACTHVLVHYDMITYKKTGVLIRRTDEILFNQIPKHDSPRDDYSIYDF
jgi:hypothetical protein